jgi:hypothetical protein
MLRLELHGPCPLHGELLRDSRYWQSELDALSIDIGDLWLEQVLFHTRPLRTTSRGALEDSALQGLLQASIGDVDDLLSSPELQTLEKHLPGELFKDGPLIPEKDKARQALLSEVRDMVLAEIIPSEKL